MVGWLSDVVVVSGRVWLGVVRLHVVQAPSHFFVLPVAISFSDSSASESELDPEEMALQDDPNAGDDGPTHNFLIGDRMFKGVSSTQSQDLSGNT